MKNINLTIFIPVTQLSAKWTGEFEKLPSNQTYELVIDYPLLDNPAKFKINTGKNGLGLTRLLGIIGKKYNYIYENEDKYNIYGHGIEDLQLCGIRVDHKRKSIKLDISS